MNKETCLLGDQRRKSQFGKLILRYLGLKKPVPYMCEQVLFLIDQYLILEKEKKLAYVCYICMKHMTAI